MRTIRPLVSRPEGGGGWLGLPASGVVLGVVTRHLCRGHQPLNRALNEDRGGHHLTVRAAAETSFAKRSTNPAGSGLRPTPDRTTGNQMDSIPVLSPNFSVGIPSLSSIATRRLDIVVSGAFRM